MSVTMGEAQVVDLSDNPEMMQQVEQALGRFGIQMDQAAQAHGQAGSPGPAEDDPIAKIERLAALRQSGALTDEEFQEQKRRILGA